MTVARDLAGHECPCWQDAPPEEGLLVALLAALSVVWPGEYHVPENRPDLEAQTFRRLYDRKRHVERVALVAFGTSLIAFGLMVGAMLLMRYNA